MQLCRQPDLVNHVRQSFADRDRDRDRNRRRYIAHNRHSLRHYVKKVPRRRCPINDTAALRVGTTKPEKSILSGEFPLAWTRCQIGGRFTLWDRQTDRLARIVGHS